MSTRQVDGDVAAPAGSAPAVLPGEHPDAGGPSAGGPARPPRPGAQRGPSIHHPGPAHLHHAAHPARLDRDLLLDRAAHVVVDLVALALLLAVPVLATLVAVAVQPAAVPSLATTALTLAGAAVLLGFGVAWPHHDGGRTAGMRWLGLRVVDPDGGTPAPWRLLVRAVLLPVDVVVGPLLVLLRPDGRRVGDLLAGTVLVRDVSGAAVPAPRRGTARSPLARWRPAAPPPPR